jgi:hypothetical protein
MTAYLRIMAELGEAYGRWAPTGGGADDLTFGDAPTVANPADPRSRSARLLGRLSGRRHAA